MSKNTDWDKSRDVSEQTLSYFIKGMKTLWRLIGTERKRILGAAILLAVGQAMGLAIPLLFKLILDGLQNIAEQGITTAILWLVAAMFLIRIVALVITRFVQEPMFLKAIIALENHWPQLAQEKLLALSVGYHERENTGRKIAKVNKGVEKLVAMLADLFWSALPAFLYLVINIPVMIFVDWKLGLLFIIPLFPYVWINLRSYSRFYPVWLKWEKMKEKSVGLFCQSIINVRTVQAFVRERREAKSHGTVRKDMRNLDIEFSLIMQKYFFAMETVLGVFFLITVVSGLYFVYRGWSTVGDVAYVYITGNVALQGLWGMIHVYTRILRNLVAAERMEELLQEEIGVANLSPGVTPEGKQNRLSFRSITHTYPGKETPVIEDFNLQIEPGEMLALVGASGSGKSTLVNLLIRALDPTEGSITIDGRDAREVDRDWYRRHYAVVPQDVEIYEGTIRENITLAHPNASKEQVDSAVEASYLTEVVSDTGRFPDGLETQVGEKGVRLSGGEKQRVGIARAYISLLSGSQVLILDEATSSLDSQSESVVQRFIEKLRQDQAITIVAIAHRLSTIYTADRICVLEKGKIAELGSHERLLQENGLYKKLVSLQDLHVVHE